MFSCLMLAVATDIATAATYVLPRCLLMFARCALDGVVVQLLLLVRQPCCLICLLPPCHHDVTMMLLPLAAAMRACRLFAICALRALC